MWMTAYNVDLKDMIIFTSLDGVNVTLSCDQAMEGGGSPLKEQERVADWPGIVMMSVGCWVIVGTLSGAGE